MKTMLLKELRWILGSTLLLTLAFAWPFVDLAFPALWVQPLSGRAGFALRNLMRVGLGVGIAFGIMTVLLEEMLGTLEWLRHRSIGASGVFGAKALAGAAALVTAMLVAPLCLWAWGSHEDPNRIIALPSRIGLLAGVASIALPCWAMGMLATALGGELPRRLLVALLGGWAVALVSEALARPAPGDWSTSIGMYVAVNLALTAVLLWAAWRVFVGADEGRALRERLLLSAGAIVVLVCTLGAVLVLGQLEQRALTSLASTAPDCVQLPDGTVVLSRFLRPHDFRQVDPATHEPMTDTRPWESEELDVLWNTSHVMEDGAPFAAVHSTRRPYAWEGTWASLRPAWVADHRDGSYEVVPGTQTWLDRGAGTLEQLGLLSTGQRVVDEVREPARETARVSPFRRRLERRDGVFSAATELRERAFNSASLTPTWLGDPADGSVWYVRDGDPEARLEPAALAGGDRFVRWKTSADGDVLAQGEQAVHRWTGQQFEVAAEGGQPRLDAAPASWDPMSYELVVRDPDGVEVFRHAYEPRTGRELRSAALSLCCSALRPPLPAWLNMLTPVHSPLWSQRFARSLLFDPLLAGNNRLWIPVVSTVLSLLLAFAAWRTLAARGASQRRRVFWTFALLAGGPAAGLVLGILEVRVRRKTPVRAPVSAATPILISPRD